MNNLNNYLAKSNKQTLKEHNNDLKLILKYIKTIFNLSEGEYNQMIKIIKYHDIGKITDSMQSILNGYKCNYIRHEILSASIKGLLESELLAIITHHKSFEDNKILNTISSDLYLNQLKEIHNKLGLDMEDLNKNKKIFRPTNKALKDLNNILLKGYLNYCDHLASAGIKNIDVGFNALDSFKFTKYNSIQKQAMLSEEDILIMAMTGFGKTATSLFWSDIVQNINKSKRIYFILPFTASINSLYKDFVSREISTSMLHSKAEYFLKDIDKDIDYNLLKYSTKQINICTIFQLVKAIFGCKRFEMLLAQMKNSIIIVDEIHCFDIKTLTYILELLRWLKLNLGVRICIMSASIPTCLQNLIKERLDIHKVIIPDKNELIVRHRIHRKHKTLIDDIHKIQEHLNKGEQVLICSNNVNTSQTLYKLFSKEYQCKLIHGRMNSFDRSNAEKGLKTNQLLIGTQAIEVSLDISYDVLFTEVAPWDSLLQRFGRVNRKGEKGIKDIYIYNNYDYCIYPEEILKRTDLVIKEIISNDNSIVYEDKVNYFLDIVYPDFNIEEYNTYKNQLSLIINNMKLGYYNKNATDDMLDIDTIQVLPMSLYTEYNTYIDSKDYLKAEGLKVNISKKKYDGENVVFNKNIDSYITYYRYSSNIGLEYEIDSDYNFL